MRKPLLSSLRFDSSGDLIDGLYRVGNLASGWKVCVLKARIERFSN